MALEAETLRDKLETPNPMERRARAERRGPDRRRDDSRVNPDAPRRSLLKALGAFGVALSSAMIVLTLLGSEMLGSPVPIDIFAFEAGALFTALILFALGSLELRLIEIRLELMMLNGGERVADRRGVDRRDG